MSAVETTIDVPHLTFETGLPGFPKARTFALMNTELAQEPFAIMRCVEDESLEFVVVPPHLFFPDYAPEVDDATATRLGIKSAEDAILLVTLTVGEDVASITANLLGPIVINKTTHVATQAVLTGQNYDLQEPLFKPETLKHA